MKRLLALLPTVTLWLAGCAILGPQSPTDPNQTGALPPVPVATLEGNQVATLAAPNDLWERMRNGFAMPDLDHELVLHHQQRYLKHRDHTQRVTERSRRYLFHIIEQLEMRSMPTELALLPYVESAFNPEAVSSAKAAGLWQFIPSTGTLFDLEQNALRDERRNVIASTRAALDYLQQLHDQFGDWHLALAAYNWGPGSVSRAIARNESQGLGTAYTDLSMPAETRNYVPQLQALKNIIADPVRHGVVLPNIGNHPFFDTVAITQDMDVEVAARVAGISLEDFRALNPAHKRPVILASETPHILLPWENAATFERNLASDPSGALSAWTGWVTPASMSAATVAKRFGMDEATLRRMNGIAGRRSIHKGTTLLVARAGAQPAATSVATAAAPASDSTEDSVLQRTIVRARAGDTIARLASRYDLPPATVARWNKTQASAALPGGREIILYLPGDDHAAEPREPEISTARAAPAVPSARHGKVAAASRAAAPSARIRPVAVAARTQTSTAKTRVGATRR